MRKHLSYRIRFRMTSIIIIIGLLYYFVVNYAPTEYSKDIFRIAVALFLVILLLRGIYSYNKRMANRKRYHAYLGTDIEHVDTLTGIEFERYLQAHFRHMGYYVQLTPPQNDFGVDLVLSKGRDRIAVQAKRYNHEHGYKVTYRAVQEVAAGKAYYHCNKGIVITNSFFTASAKKLAGCNHIELWDRTRLIQEFQVKTAPDYKEYKNSYYQISS